MIAAGGLLAGSQGNGSLNIHGAPLLTVSGGITIGQDASRATAGQLILSGGTLNINGTITLGSSGGIGTFTRSGGAMNVSGTGGLVIDGAATLVLNGATASAATIFSGSLNRPNVGTLVVIPATGNLATTEAASFSNSCSLTSGIVGAWAVQQASAADTQGNYLTLVNTGSGYNLAATASASYDTNFAAPNSNGSSLENVSGSATVSGNTTVYTMKISGTATLTAGSKLTLGSGGEIFNGGMLSGGTVNCGTRRPCSTPARPRRAPSAPFWRAAEA